MPSHRLHSKWASLYGVPDDIASRVNEIIDYAYGEHDLGEVKQRYLVVDNVKIPLGKDITVHELENILMLEFPDKREYKLAVKAALLHHFLDKIERCLKEVGILAVDYSEKVIDYAEEKMRQHYLHVLSREEFRKLYSFLKEHSREVVHDVLEDMKSKGIRSIDYIGPTILADFLKEYIERHGYEKFILIPSHIHGERPLPLMSATRKIFHELKKGNRVTIKFVTEIKQIFSRKYMTTTKPYNFKSLEELIEFLKSQ